MDAYCYCPSCGFFEKFDFDTTDTCFDAERHCGDCGKAMITQCTNPLCTSHIIESLSRKYCPCGTEYLNITKAQKRHSKPRVVRDVYDEPENYSLDDGPS